MLGQKIKNLLARIVRAQFQKKKKLKVLNIPGQKKILGFLWKKGYILGYTTNGKDCSIILKQHEANYNLFRNLTFKDQIIKRTELLSTHTLEKNTRAIILTNKGIFLSDGIVKKGHGGKLLAKL